MNRRWFLGGLAAPLVAAKQGAKAELVSCERIWDRAPHSAFTDLVRYHDQWFCCFREGEKHVSPDGAVRILKSETGEVWRPWARIEHPVADLRDPKLTVTPAGALMLTAAGAMHPPSDARHKTFVWFSGDGRDWTAPEMIGEPDIWLWRVVWHAGKAYGFGYSTGAARFSRVYMSTDGRKFHVLNPECFRESYPNETALVFNRDGSAYCLLRRDGDVKTAQLGVSRPPYRGWTWKDLGVRIGGPQMLRLADGRIVFAGRLYDGQQRTALAWLNPEEGELTEFLTLPSNGDSSYPGLVYHDDLLWMSYYSSHEERTSIYLAKVKLPPPGR
jgi:hypothetical protein